MEDAFAKPIDEVLGALGVHPTTGLTDEQVSRQQAKYGKNGKQSPRDMLFRS
jgi:Ca2+ transporting ATPase